MALQEEAMAFQDLYSYSNGRDVYNIFGENSNWGSEFDHLVQTEEKLGCLDILENRGENFGNNYSSDLSHLVETQQGYSLSSVDLETTKMEAPPPPSETSTTCRPKRRKPRNIKDIENQRMTHIAVERNRRKQMNEYLSLLRSLMPESYVQRVDQASIVGGAINYVKELEQQLHFLSVQNHKNQNYDEANSTISSSSPFAEFFAFPQYSTISSYKEKSIINCDDDDRWEEELNNNYYYYASGAAMADIEVTMVESHANMKIRSKARPKQLLILMNELQILRLTVLHLSVTTVNHIVLYSLCVKVEDDCSLNSGEDIATAVNQILVRSQTEGKLSFY